VHEGVCGEFEQKEEAVGAAEEDCPSCISSVVRIILTKSEANIGHELVAGLDDDEMSGKLIIICEISYYSQYRYIRRTCIIQW
jgi:hypothetical protein